MLPREYRYPSLRFLHSMELNGHFVDCYESPEESTKEMQQSVIKEHCQQHSASCPITQSGDTTLDEWIERIYEVVLPYETLQSGLDGMRRLLFSSVVNPTRDATKGRKDEVPIPCQTCLLIKKTIMLTGAQRKS